MSNSPFSPLLTNQRAKTSLFVIHISLLHRFFFFIPFHFPSLIFTLFYLLIHHRPVSFMFLLLLCLYIFIHLSIYPFLSLSLSLLFLQPPSLSVSSPSILFSPTRCLFFPSLCFRKVISQPAGDTSVLPLRVGGMD